jgi:hypothetical protein
MEKFDVVPNYYKYFLQVNGKALNNKQKKHFFNCVNKIHRENYKFIYRGQKREFLQSIYNDANFAAEFRYSLFLMGAKAGMFGQSALPSINEIDIAEAGNNEFYLIFRMLCNLLRRQFPFGATRMALTRFKKREADITVFFSDDNNLERFIHILSNLPRERRIIVRDYYLALLHHISKSEYYSSSFLLSTTTNFLQSQKFAWKGETEGSNNPVVLFGWIPKNYEGILNVPDTTILARKIDMNALGLPVYERTFFYTQEEVTLKGGLLPHYLLGYLHNYQSPDVFEINPTLFQVDDSWNGIELPIDQSTFNERIQHTVFGRYFTMDAENGQYRQYFR